MAKVVVIIPTYNEKENTERMIETLAEIIPDIKGHEMNVLYVDANSPDGTARAIKEKQEKYKWLHLLIETKKEGLGMAYAKGMMYAMDKLNADYLMEFDSDFQHQPKDIPRLVEQINSGYDYIIGSRYVKGGSIPKEWGMDRKFLSVIGNLVARTLLIIPQIHDVTGGFKLARVKGFVENFDFTSLLSKSFAYKIHLLFYMVQRQAKVKEVPIEFKNRTAGESKIIKNEMQETLRVIFLLQSKNPKVIRFLKFAIVGFLGFAVNSISLELFRYTSLPKLFASQFQNHQDKDLLGLLAYPTAWAGGLAAEAAIISNFIFNNFWTFSSDKIVNPVRFLFKIAQFNLTSLGAIAIQFIVIGMATKALGDTVIVRQLSLIMAIGLLIIPYNWFMYNTFIWKAKPDITPATPN